MRLTWIVTANFNDLHPADREGIEEDIEDVVRGVGGHGVVIETKEETS